MPVGDTRGGARRDARTAPHGQQRLLGHRRDTVLLLGGGDEGEDRVPAGRRRGERCGRSAGSHGRFHHAHGGSSRTRTRSPHIPPRSGVSLHRLGDFAVTGSASPSSSARENYVVRITTSACGTRLLGGVAVGACALAGVAATSGTSEAANGQVIDIQVLSFNDFHGNLEPPTGSSGRCVTATTERGGDAGRPVTDGLVDALRDVGGVEYLATHLKEARKGHPNTLTVAAGDLIGASPLLSAAFHDEPTHRVDEHARPRRLGRRQPRVRRGLRRAPADGERRLHRRRPGRREQPELLRRCTASRVPTSPTSRPTSSTPAPTRTILPAYTVKNVLGAKIGFIGMTLKDTPSIVTASGVAGLEFTDEVRDRERPGAGAARSGRQRHRRPHPPGWDASASRPGTGRTTSPTR